MSYHKYLLRGAVLAFSGLLMVGCSGSSQNTEESLTSDSKPVESISVNLSETPGDWLEALKVDEASIKETNDFHVTTVSGECYFSSETELSRDTNEDSEKEDAEHVVGDNDSESSGIDAPTGSQPSTDDPKSENQLSYKVKSNEGELEFTGNAKQDSVAVKTRLGDGSKIQLIYGCNKGIVDNKKHLESKLGEMISLVDIKIERNNG